MDLSMIGEKPDVCTEQVANPIAAALHSSGNDILPFGSSFPLSNNLTFQDIPIVRPAPPLQNPPDCSDGLHIENDSNNSLSIENTAEVSSDPDNCTDSDTFKFALCSFDKDEGYNLDKTSSEVNSSSFKGEEGNNHPSAEIPLAISEKIADNVSNQPSLPPLNNSANQHLDVLPGCNRNFVCESTKVNESTEKGIYNIAQNFIPCKSVKEPSCNFSNQSVNKTIELNKENTHLEKESYQETSEIVPNESFKQTFAFSDQSAYNNNNNNKSNEEDFLQENSIPTNSSFNFSNRIIHKTSGLDKGDMHSEKDSFQETSESVVCESFETSFNFSNQSINEISDLDGGIVHLEKGENRQESKSISAESFEQTVNSINQTTLGNNQGYFSSNNGNFKETRLNTISDNKEVTSNVTSVNLAGESCESILLSDDSISDLPTTSVKESENCVENICYQAEKSSNLNQHSINMDNSKDLEQSEYEKHFVTDVSKSSAVFPNQETENMGVSSSSNVIYSALKDSVLSDVKKVEHTIQEKTVGVSKEFQHVGEEKTTTSPLEKLNEHLSFISENTCSSNNTNKSNTEKYEQIHNVESSEIDVSNDLNTSEISNKETGFPAAFSGLVTIGKYIPVTGDFTLRSSEALIESPSLIAPYLLKEPDVFPTKLDDSKGEPKDFFYSAAGELLMGIGLSQVTEWYHRDMIRSKKRHIKKEGNTPQLEEDLKMHEKCYIEAKRANSIYSFRHKYCETCGFSSESSLVLEGHLLIPHLSQRKDFQCNFCEFYHRDLKSVLDHMIMSHKKLGRLQPPIFLFHCPYCTFETNSKVKINTHLAKCQRFFDISRNQLPPKDFEFPTLTPKPITVAVVKAYEKSLNSMQRGRGRPRKIDVLAEQMNFNQLNSITHTPSSSINVSTAPHPIAPYRPTSTPLSEHLSSMANPMISPISLPNMNLRSPHPTAMNHLRTSLPSLHLPPSNRFFQLGASAQLMPMLNNNPMVTSASQFHFNPSLVNTASKKLPSSNQYFNTAFNNSLRQQNPPKNVPEISLPKLQGPYPVPINKTTVPAGNTPMPSNSLIVCEICDGYIKDLEQLRSHMMLIHKVKIHPKMLVSRPPLNCQKCQWRFFTDQGLERHLLGSHGLVTSNMQELANRNKDAGCCTICGRVYASKLVSHMNQVHKITLKPAHLSYKCTVCSATFNLYRLFENHVYLVHSGAAKRSSDDSASRSKKLRTYIEQ